MVKKEAKSAKSKKPRLDKEQTKKVAQLSRLELTEDELEKFTDQLAAVLQYAEDINSLNLDGVEPTSHPFPLKNVLRSDEISEDLSERGEVLKAAPSTEDKQFKVPPILSED